MEEETATACAEDVKVGSYVEDLKVIEDARFLDSNAKSVARSWDAKKLNIISNLVKKFDERGGYDFHALSICSFLDEIQHVKEELITFAYPLLKAKFNGWERLALALYGESEKDDGPTRLLRRAMNERTTSFMDRKDGTFKVKEFKGFIRRDVINRSFIEGLEMCLFPHRFQSEIDDVGHSHTCAEEDRRAMVPYLYWSLYKGREDPYEISRALNVAAKFPSLVVYCIVEHKDLIERKLGKMYESNIVYHCICTRKNDTLRCFLTEERVRKLLSPEFAFFCAASFDNVEALEILLETFGPSKEWVESMHCAHLLPRTIDLVHSKMRSYSDKDRMDQLIFLSLAKNGHVSQLGRYLDTPSFVKVIESEIAEYAIEHIVSTRTCESLVETIMSIEDDSVRSELLKWFRVYIRRAYIHFEYKSDSDEAYLMEIYESVFRDRPSAISDDAVQMDMVLLGLITRRISMQTTDLKYFDLDRDSSHVDLTGAIEVWSMRFGKQPIDEEGVRRMVEFITPKTDGSKTKMASVDTYTHQIGIRGLRMIEYLAERHGIEIEFSFLKEHPDCTLCVYIDDGDIGNIDEFVYVAKRISRLVKSRLKIEVHEIMEENGVMLSTPQVKHFIEALAAESDLFRDPRTQVFLLVEFMHRSLKQRNLDCFRYIAEECLSRDLVEQVKGVVHDRDDGWNIMKGGKVMKSEPLQILVNFFSDALSLCVTDGFEEGIVELQKYIHWRVRYAKRRLLSGRRELFRANLTDREEMLRLGRFTICHDYDLLKFSSYVNALLRSTGIDPLEEKAFDTLAGDLFPSAKETLKLVWAK